MRNNFLTFFVLTLMFAALMSVPFLVPGAGWVALFGLVPLLFMDEVADQLEMKHFFWWYYAAFVLWNAVTTFWVCNATVGGGIFAVLANAFQMALVWAVFRLSKKRFFGVLPYVFLAVMWIAWERAYFSAQISWPWLTLGNSLAGTVKLAQWYEYTGTLGGSLWIWACNIWLFLILKSALDGTRFSRPLSERLASWLGVALLLACPVIVSLKLYENRGEKAPGEELEVVIAQPNFDPYEKFSSIPRAQQNVILLDLFEKGLRSAGQDTASGVLLLAPETFTSDIVVGDYPSSPTWSRFQSFLQNHPSANILFGASSFEFIPSSAESYTARTMRDGSRYESHNSALITDASSRTEIYHKSKLVVGTELTPYPRFFTKIDNMLGGVMGRCVGQDSVSLLRFKTLDASGKLLRDIPLGSIICYESAFGEYCTKYVKEGAKALVVITNDAWWGDTPGYRQHFSFSSLRAIETRREIARCANTGISGFINSRGDVLSSSHWWEREHMEGSIRLSDERTFFVRYGDITGRICTLAFLLLLLALLVRLVTMKVK